MNFGSMGNGTSLHLYAETLQDVAGFRMTHVPYRGAGPAFTDLVAGRIQMMLAAPPTVLGAVRGGQVRVLAIGTAGGRIPALPEVPTAREAGIDFPLSYWYGLVGPKGLDPAVAARMLEGIRQVHALPEVRARFAEQGGVPIGGDGATLAALLAEELGRWTALIRAKGITQ
jgi:tripartite-type tricarboxylate transporter receptor subunit TctC